MGGRQVLDGRATGWTLGDPLAEQAQGPFLNPLEQNNASAQVVIDKALGSSYGGLSYRCVAPHRVLRMCRPRHCRLRTLQGGRLIRVEVRCLSEGPGKLTGQEQRGLELFEGKAQCANCHNGLDFTDFTYDNLGVPRNPANPFYKELDWNPLGEAWVDEGFGGFLQSAGYPEETYGPEMGKQKVPTLRNVDLRPEKKFVKAYGHNGYFKSLEEIVHFYNRAMFLVLAGRRRKWPPTSTRPSSATWD